MQLLLDTVAFIRAIRAPELLGKNVRRLLENPANVLDLSTISVVEIAIKTRKGRLDLSAEEVDQALSRLSVRLLPFGWRNAFKFFDLPSYHHDHFDRQIIAQALVEGVPVATTDKIFEKYGVQVVW
jgi:PIN domain nuclease of toxin-antitoxin system